MIPTIPRASASVAALVMLAGLALVYWSLTGLGALVPATTAATPANAPASGSGGGGAGGGF